MKSHTDAEHRVSLIGGPLDGWPIVVRGKLPEKLTLPYSRQMLDLAARSPNEEVRADWQAIRFPSESDADGVAVYHLISGTGEASPVYTFAGTHDCESNDEQSR